MGNVYPSSSITSVLVSFLLSVDCSCFSVIILSSKHIVKFQAFISIFDILKVKLSLSGVNS